MSTITIKNWTLVLIFFSMALVSIFWQLKNIDFQFYDEAFYLINSTNLSDIQASWSPLYSIWYKTFSWWGTFLEVYMRNYVLQTFLLSVIIIISYLTNRSIETLIFGLILISGFGVSVWPKVTYLIAILCFAVPLFFNLAKIKDNQSFFKIMSLFALMLSYIRPEFYLTFILCLLIVINIVFRNKKLDYFSSIIFFLFSLSVFYLPLGGDRSLVAFGQHYAIHQNLLGSMNINPWVEWQTILNNDFNNPSGFLEIISNNPAGFFEHVINNLSYPLLIFFDKSDFIKENLWLRYPVALISFFLFISIVYLIKKISKTKNHFFIFLSFMSPLIISIVLIYPRNHYLVMLFAFTYMGIAIFFKNQFIYKNILLNLKIFLITLLFSLSSFFILKQDSKETYTEINDLISLDLCYSESYENTEQLLEILNFNKVCEQKKDSRTFLIVENNVDVHSRKSCKIYFQSKNYKVFSCSD